MKCLLVTDPRVSADKTSPNEVIAVIKEVEFEKQIFIRLFSFPFTDQLREAIVVLVNIVSSMFISKS